jgi:hypothetical protein
MAPRGQVQGDELLTTVSADLVRRRSARWSRTRSTETGQIWSTSHLNWTNPRVCLTQSGPYGAAALFAVSLDAALQNAQIRTFGHIVRW